jgi:IclR family transcriptional regulator, acetate operon repressor
MLEKGLDLLMALGEYPDGVGVSELARGVGLPVSTVHRLLGTMVERKFASFDPSRRLYYLGLKVFELSHKVSLVQGLSEVALPPMRRVVKATGEPSLLSVLQGEDLVYVERVEGWRGIQIRGSVGERGPLHATSMGKVLLAFLPEEEQEEITSRLNLESLTPDTITDLSQLREELRKARERGYAIADEEREEGIRAIAVPVLNSRGNAAAAICVAAPAYRVSLKDLESFLPLLQEAAQEIGLKLPRGAVPTLRSKLPRSRE